MMQARSRLGRMSDERLAALVAKGDATAFEAIYDRHHAALLAFCRHMLGNREDGEDALQQAFVRAHRSLADGRLPDAVRPWLFAIARNRCLTVLAARREAGVPLEDVEPGFDGLADEVQQRAELRELVGDLAGLPDDQRGALVLAELGDLSHPEIAQVIGCPRGQGQGAGLPGALEPDRGSRRAARVLRRDPVAARDGPRRHVAARAAAASPAVVRPLRGVPRRDGAQPVRPGDHPPGPADGRSQGGRPGRRGGSRRGREGCGGRGARGRRGHLGR